MTGNASENDLAFNRIKRTNEKKGNRLVFPQTRNRPWRFSAAMPRWKCESARHFRFGLASVLSAGVGAIRRVVRPRSGVPGPRGITPPRIVAGRSCITVVIIIVFVVIQCRTSVVIITAGR